MCRDFKIFAYSWKAYKALQRLEERCREKRCCGWEDSAEEKVLLDLMSDIERKTFKALTGSMSAFLGNEKNEEGFLADRWFEVFYLSENLEDALERLERIYADAYLEVNIVRKRKGL